MPLLGRNADGGVVLLGTTRVVGEVRRGREAVDLCRGILHSRPGAPAVDGHNTTTVIAIDHAEGVPWIDPDVVVIGVRLANTLQRTAGIGRLHEPEIEDVDRVPVDRVGLDPLEVERPLPDVSVCVHEGPRRASVVRHVEASGLSLHVRPDPLGICAGHGDRYFAQNTGRRSHTTRRETRIVGQFGPGIAAIRRLEDSRTFPAAPQLPGLPVHLPERRIKDVRVVRIHDEIDRASAVVPEQNLVPGPAAVGGPEDAAVGTRAERMSESSHESPLRVGRVHPDPADRLGVLQTDVTPVPPAIVGAIHTVALKHIRSQLHLAHPDVDDVRVRFCNCHRPDRATPYLTVRHRGPRGATVGGLEEPTTRRAEVVLERSIGVSGYGDRAPATVRSNRSPLERGHQCGLPGGGLRRCWRREKCQQRHRRRY